MLPKQTKKNAPENLTKTEPETEPETKPETEPETKDVSAEVAEPVLNLPPISKSAEALAEKQAENPPVSSSPVDVPNQTVFPYAVSDGDNEDEFNPEIHAVDENGIPKRNKDGSLSKKRGRKSNKNSEAIGTISLPSDDARVVGAKQAAIAAVQTLITIGQIIGGDEWNPKTDPTTGISETDMLVKAYTDWFLVSGIDNVPPWIGACIATGAYCLPRFQLPKTRGFFGRMWDKVKPWISFKKK